MSASIKILFLHGYTQSGPSFHAKTRALEKTILKALPTGSSLHFPTAPHPLQPSDLPGRPRAPSTTPSDNWAWWRRNDTTGAYDGLDETWVFLSAYLTTHGPFDGCVGFSQGGALAAILTSLLERTRPIPASFTTPHPPFKFSVSYSGFRLTLGEFYDPPIATPVLHFLGSLDTVVDEARSMQLVEACGVDGAHRVVFHPGGHYLPAGRQYVGVLLGFVRDCMGLGLGLGLGSEKEVGGGLDLPF